VLPAASRSWSGGELERRFAFAFVEACEEVCEVVAGERPVEGIASERYVTKRTSPGLPLRAKGALR